ncbi:hypothetical protein CAOG_01874 [Capsaspora owczarzaki ATCC 30864]|uniref:Major facilitator superfamily (MFS) profile domain-containing protein n=1 Tax=Capsaspora owczarzaki (strain ATCC 30864) TaxID=595528 RepID=A0A0D2U626_CAPO3|nr:hypothetical protein CAOG_01874 [Capsaspora owczarzaki ATCC 30864]KJE90576.1 hypothetical protein CAOG_001874 [Capsaspora owczarzaki ATCC 30864]|eukprot:XP_004364742.2 hypothetical protein CAOG_01874 [Capsaspora owczarzaki ATCC 30864]
MSTHNNYNALENTPSAVSIHQQNGVGAHKVYKRRWLMLTVVCLLNIVNAAQWIQYAPIADTVKRYYDVSSTWVNMLSQIFMILYIPFGFMASWALDTRGLRYACVLGAVLNAVGAFIKYMANFVEITPSADPNIMFAVVMVGQFFAAAAQPFILGAPTMLAAVWFSDSERATANMLASVANPIGIAAANVLSPAIVDTTEPWTINTMHWMMMIPAGIVAVITIVLMRAKPPTPPSLSAATPSDPFFVGLKKVATNKSYLLLLVSFGVGLGIFNALSTLLEQIVHPQGYTDDDAGIFGAALIGAGLVGAGISGPLIDKTKAYRPVLRGCFILATASFVGFALSARPDEYVLVAVTCGLIGFFCFPLLPTCLELAVEVTYPVSEGTSASFMWMAGQALGVVFIFIMDAMRTGAEEDMTNALWFAVGVVGATLIPVFLFKGEYRRLNMERETKANASSGLNGDLHI